MQYIENEESHNLCCAADAKELKPRSMRLAGFVALEGNGVAYRVWTGFKPQVACCYNLSNETSISIRRREFLDDLKGYLHPKKDFVTHIFFY